MKKRPLSMWLCLLMLLMILGLVPVTAQDTVTISVAIPEYIIDGFPDEAIARFEAEYPGVKVNIKPSQQNPGYSPQGDIESFLDSMEAYASEADVLLVSSGSQVIPEATRAGIFLDISPLILSDPTFNTDDFYYPVWQSYQWDGGIWGVPMVADVVGIAYRADLFDQNNVPYPDSWTTATDFDLALRDLVSYDDEGAVQVPALIDLNNSIDMLMFAFTGGQRFVDDLQFPSVPDYSNPQLEELIQLWADLRTDGIIPSNGGFEYIQEAPVLLIPSIFASSNAIGTDDFTITTLPGEYIGLAANGLAVSSGTIYPQEAYDFVKFVSQDPQLANAFLGAVPARRSLLGADSGEQGTIASLLNPSEEIQELVNTYIDSAISPPDLRFGNYLALAIDKVVNDGIDPVTALQETEQEVLDRLAIVDERGENSSIVVTTPPPDLVINEGEIALEFGISTFTTNISNQEDWDNAIADFISANPDVINVDIAGATFFSGNTLADMSEQYDCFYTTGNIVQNGDVSKLLNISPLIASDPNVDVNDFVGGVLNQMSRDSQVYGLPMEIQPQSMVYDTDLINQGGAFPPYAGWTVADFENILRTLKVDPEDPAPFSPQDFGGTGYLFNLITAYGGIPIDYRTQPITLDLASSTNVNAIRQVLDLAKEGYIDYQPLANFSGGGASDQEGPFALYTQILSQFTDVLGGGSEEGNANNPQVPIPFPNGTEYSAVSYDMGGLYVSSNTDFADACYRFISFVSTDSNLISAMPARQSVLSDPTLATNQGQEIVQLYNDLATKLSAPNTIAIPAGLSNSVDGVGDMLVVIWIAQAFDRYVLEDADLETELEEAQLFSENYLECSAAVPPFDPAVDQTLSYFRKFFDCAIKVDPSLEGVLPQF